MKEINYSKDLKQIIDRKPTWITLHGIGIIFLLTTIAIYLSKYIQAPLSFRASATIGVYDPKTNPNANKFTIATEPIILARIFLNSQQVKNIDTGDVIVFEKINAKGLVKSISSIGLKENRATLSITIIGCDDKSQQIFLRASGLKTAVKILYKQKSVYERLFNFNLR